MKPGEALEQFLVRVGVLKPLQQRMIRSGQVMVPKVADEVVRSLWETKASVGDILGKLSVKKLPEILVDPLLREAHKHLIDPTPVNLKWCFDVEGSIQRITKLMGETIVGAGWELKKEGGDPDAVTKLEELYEDQFDMTEFVEIATENLVMWGNSFWVPRFEGKEFVRIHSLDWRTLKVWRDPFTGREQYIQEVMIPDALMKKTDDKIEPISQQEWEELKPELMSTSFSETEKRYFKILLEKSVCMKHNNNFVFSLLSL